MNSISESLELTQVGYLPLTVMQLIFLGSPGAGKTTQAAILAAHWRLPHLSVNDIVRQAIATSTVLGFHAQACLAANRPLPDLLMIALVRDRLEQPDAQRGWILDGFPQSLVQAQALEDLLGGMGRSDVLAIHFETSTQILLERLLGCSRQATNEPGIRQRLTLAQNKMAPLLEFYQQRQCLYPINGNLPIEAVTRLLQVSLRD